MRERGRIKANPQTTKTVKARVFAGDRVESRELILLAIVFATGIGLRLMALSRSAVEHFDEGVYASNIYFGPPEYAYPMQRFYAPPLLPALIEAGMIAGLAPNVAALLPGFLAGCGTIVALWWFGRSWFGPEVGIAAATLAALSDYHVLYSTAALTDVLLGLWIVLAVDAVGRSLVGKRETTQDGTRSVPATYGDFRWAIAAGIYTGLAWWTKYNGWLPLAIEATALPILWLAVRPSRKEAMSWLTCFATTALIAGLIWTPYYVSLQSQGGYGPIAANHAKYVVGISGWLDTARQQVAAMGVLESAFDNMAVVLAPLAALWLSKRNASSRFWGQLAIIICLGFAGLVLGVLVLVTIVASGRNFGAVLSLNQPGASDWSRRRMAVGTVLLAVWFGALFIATPLYTPYPRLMLPWLAAAWLGAGFAMDWLVRLEEIHVELQRTRWRFIALLLTWAAMGVLVALLNPKRPNLVLVKDRTGLMRASAGIKSAIPSADARGIYVYGEPALYFQLRAAGEDFVSPVQDVPEHAATMDRKAIPTYLAIGPHGERDPRFKEQWMATQERWEQVDSFPYTPSALVWLDLHDPRTSELVSDEVIRLYRLRE